MGPTVVDWGILLAEAGGGVYLLAKTKHHVWGGVLLVLAAFQGYSINTKLMESAK